MVGTNNERYLIQIEGLTKVYNEDGPQSTVALSELELDVRESEFLSIVGPSGCGKSTLLQVLAGLVQQSNGSVRIRGEEIRGPSRDVGMVFQEYSLFPWRSVLRNAEFGLEIQGVDKEERQTRAQEMLELVGLQGFEDAYPDELSGGMQQRVALARTLAVDPDILLMDEPFGALDEQTRLLMGEELLRIWNETKKTIIFITHSLQESVHLSDRVAVMSGRPGTVKRIFEIDIDRPRDTDVFGSEEFNRTQSEIWKLIQEESQQLIRS